MASLNVEPLDIEVIALSQPNSPKLHITPKPASTVLSEHSVLLHPEQDLILAFRNLYNLEKRVYRLKSRTRCNSFCIALLFVLVIPIAILSIIALIYCFHYF
jgi:hypothetical protein